MLRLRLNVNVQCPRRPARQYEILRPECAVCFAIGEAANAAREVERHIKFAERGGAEVRWKNFKRSSPPPA